MQHVLRAISGPQAGAVYVLGHRTTIGRASDCEIQILHEGVSRHHAKITREEDGTMSIADLSSDNGTFIEDTRVERHVLQPGEIIRIMRSRFAYQVLEAEDVVTSAAFRRKVTSGDSLRQTFDHDKSLSTIRTSVAQGLPGGVMGDRGRPYSRPQAAAPALSGARPGAAASGSLGGHGTGSYTAPLEQEVVADAPSVRRPTPTGPPPLDESAAFVRERWPHVARGGTPPHGTPHTVTGSSLVTRRPTGSMRSMARGDEPAGSSAGSTRSSRGNEPGSSTGSYGWHAEVGQGRRERITAVPTTSAGHPSSPSSSPTPTVVSARGERAHVPWPASGPSGRMAPLAPTEHEQEQEQEHDPSGSMLPTSSASMGGGWVRVHRPLDDTPGSMRPGTTLSGAPCVDLDDDEGPRPGPLVSRGAVGSSARADTTRKTVTAEYGAIAAGGAPPSKPPEAAAIDPVLDSMKTVPAVRRFVRGSSTPTEEVPRLVDAPAKAPTADDDDDPYVKTRPRVTVVPSEAAVVPPTPRAPTAALPAEPVLPAAPPPQPAATTPALRLTRGVRTGATGYEDTLRFLRDEPPAAPIRSGHDTIEVPANVPRARAHASSAEIISALEALLPLEDLEPHEDGARPDGQTREPSYDPSIAIDPLIEVAASAAPWTADVPSDMSEIDRVELRAQQVLEGVDLAHKRREGLERLVDILEYRELRLQALRGGPGDPSRDERCAELERGLQQRPPAGDDMAAMRRYHRFVCSISAQLTHRSRGAAITTPVELEDISAGGAKVTFGEYSILAGETVWVSIGLEQADRSRVPQPAAELVVMKARVVWAKPHDAKMGLVFAGSPAYDVDPGEPLA